MKLNTTPRHYMPLPQNQSDDDESGPGKEDKNDKLSFKNPYDASECLSKSIRESETEVCTKTLPMSPLRIVMFILSLILCVLFVVVFVFFLPCNMPNDLNGTCRLTNKWRSMFYNISFSSSLNFVSKTYSSNGVIIFAYKNEEVGLVGIDAPTGKERWRLPLHGIPTSVSCNIDINFDHISECLVVGNNGLFTAIDAEKGISLWYLHNHSNLNNADAIYGEMVVSDCDADGIFDIVVSYNISSVENIFYLAVVSGGTGKVIGKLVELPQCRGPVTTWFPWKLGNKTDFILYCQGEKNGNLWLLSSKVVCDTALNRSHSLSMKHLFSVPHFVEDLYFYEVSVTDNQIVIVLDSVKFMLLEISSSAFHVVWKIYLRTHEKMRLVADGNFVQGNSQLLLIGNNMSYSKVIGLSLLNGKEMWSFTLNQTVVSAIKLIKFFGRTDGVVMKTLREFPKKKNFRKNSFAVGLKEFEENYQLVKCGSIPILKGISSENISSFCEDNTCKPEIYTSNKTVVAVADGLDTSFDVLTVSSTLYHDHNMVQNTAVAVVVKYFNLENILALPRCVG
ncbi:LOW QUALITY PROTEIN: uncharacterized protein LOC129218242 [Uloborus diversus]|uniref:LOW QUALITY PROTEIN: uncharacterized protein LOC129218242 n=1 Tax=Uloborus diversus TaxID=327109 RepID=UPI0024097249|nr:LOW QUALITY PROTEIN: uncharacterized protein LOC129218242 [Uloborus diversus]